MQDQRVALAGETEKIAKSRASLVQEIEELQHAKQQWEQERQDEEARYNRRRARDEEERTALEQVRPAARPGMHDRH